MKDFIIEIDKKHEEILQRIRQDCEVTGDLLTEYKKQFQRYAGNTDLKPYQCEISGNRLTISKAILYRNSFALKMELELVPLAADSTRLVCRFRTDALVKVFMILFSLPCIGFGLLASGIFVWGLIKGTHNLSQITDLAAIPLFAAFIFGMYFGGRKFSESNALELQNWLLNLFPHRMINPEIK